jgi:hypothetical protein
MGRPENLRFMGSPMSAFYSSFTVPSQGTTRSFSVFLLWFFIILPRRWNNVGVETVRIVPMSMFSGRDGGSCACKNAVILEWKVKLQTVEN